MEEKQTAKLFSELTSREKAIEVVRWVAVLPTAVVGSILTTAFYIIGTYLGLFNSEDADPQNWFTMSPLMKIAAAFAVGAAFVYAGASMAPRYRRYTAIAITVIFLFFACFSLVLYTSRQTETWKYITLTANIVGAVVAGFTYGQGSK